MKKDDSIFQPVEDYLAHGTSRPTTSFYPSSASCIIGKTVVGKCLRQQYWEWKNEPASQKQSYRSWLSARLGSAFEKAFLEGYRAQGLLKAADYPFRITVMGLPISGRLDGLTVKNEVIECKSAYGKAFFYSVGKEPNAEHLCQIMVYLAVLGLDTCLLPYGSRDDTGKRQGYRIRKKDLEAKGILFIKIIHRWKKLQECLNSNTLPPRDFQIDDWQCRYCHYQHLCYRKSPKSIK